MSFTKRIVNFCNHNVVLITSAGLIVGIHWMWYRIQQVPQLVSEKERKDMPIIQGAKVLSNKISDGLSSVRSGLFTSEPKNKTKTD